MTDRAMTPLSTLRAGAADSVEVVPDGTRRRGLGGALLRNVGGWLVFGAAMTIGWLDVMPWHVILATQPVYVVIGCLDASRESRASIVTATLIIIVVFLPLFFLGGVEGRLLRPLGFAYVVSILASLLVAVTVTPVLCAYLLPEARAVQTEHERRLVHWLKARYAGVLERVLAHPKRVLAGAGVALALAAAAVPFLGSAFLPEFNEGALTVSVVTVPGTSLEESNAIGRRVEEILLANAAVVNTDRRQGRAELDEHAQGVNAAEIDVTLEDGIEKERVFDELRREFASIPGTNVTIGQPIGHPMDHMLSGTRANIAVKLFGPDLDELRQVGARVRDAMQTVPGVADLQLEQQTDVPQLQIRPTARRWRATG